MRGSKTSEGNLSVCMERDMFSNVGSFLDDN